MYVGRIERLLAYYSPLPMCIVNAQGKVTRASKKIAEVFKYDGIVDYDTSPAGEGSRKSRFLAIDGCAAITDTTSDDRWSPLQTR